jgi:4-hydroxybenzoate polyprenyltransferase
LVAFCASLAFFMQLRIADEFKDIDEDTRYRPYRPVPRGLVTLRELGVVGVILGVIQLTLALWLHPPLSVVLLVTWLYLALMSHEFFARDWLKARPVTYLWTHMLIMPLIDLYATACDWLVASGDDSFAAVPEGLYLFLIVSFFNGVVIELGRKIRAPEDEEEGVDTYSVLWGRRRAVLLWIGALLVTALSAALAAWQIEFLGPVAWVLLALLLTAAIAGWSFLRHPKPGAGKRFELISGLWTLCMYLSLGAGPLLWKA